ncbi:transcript variant X2 [Nothobranchius furzeri]|uniref:Transcript variant X2 n=1 Tax=Nothobranchius furzeri TaxID=105023 RepID=A0A9D2YUS7_NOTFU|nr:transcript variant X2 [Nothobranchius furzeri]
MLLLLLTVAASFTGLSEGVGVLPDGPLTASVGGSVMFRTNLNPTETPFFAVSWNYENKPIITSTNVFNTTVPEYENRITLFRSTGSLELRNLGLNDNGEYDVIIQPADDFQKIGTTRLVVYDPVSGVLLTASSTDLVEFNSSVRLSCSSSGSSLSFLWMNSSSEVTASDRVQISSSDGGSTLTLVTVTRYDLGPFSCNVSNPVSSAVSEAVKLSVSYGPETVQLQVSPSKEHHKTGSDVQMFCSAVSSPDASFQWFVNGNPLPDTGPELRLMSVQTHQSGSYSCQAFNSKTLRYQTSQPSALSVLDPVSGVLLTTSSTDLVEFNSSVRLSCSSSGSSPSFLWMNSSSEVTASDRVQISSSDGGSTLTLVTVTRYDLGPYSCHVSNPVSSVASISTSLSISYGPENTLLTISPSKHEHVKGSDVQMFCSAVSSPDASFQWFVNENPLPDTGPELRLMSVQTHQSGSYSCQTFNSKTLRYETSQPLALSVIGGSSGLPDGIIAAIVIVCLVIVAGVGVGFWIIRKKKVRQKPTSGGIFTITGGGRKDHTANSEGLHYADLKFLKNKKGKNVREQKESTFTEYAQIKVNNGPAASSPPSTNQESNNTNVRPANNDSGRRSVLVELENVPSDYAQIRVDSSRRPAPPPPTYGLHTQSASRPLPAPRAQTYAQEQNYGDAKLPRSGDGRTDQIELENTPTNYAQIRVNSKKPPLPAPPTYKTHMQQKHRAAPPPGNSQIYAQVNKNPRR